MASSGRAPFCPPGRAIAAREQGRVVMQEREEAVRLCGGSSALFVQYTWRRISAARPEPCPGHFASRAPRTLSPRWIPPTRYRASQMAGVMCCLAVTQRTKCTFCTNSARGTYPCIEHPEMLSQQPQGRSLIVEANPHNSHRGKRNTAPFWDAVRSCDIATEWRRGESNPGPKLDRLQALRACPSD